MRRTPSRLLNRTATIKRVQRTETPTGYAENLVVRETGLKCRLSTISTAQDVDIAAALQAEVTHAIYFEHGVDVQRDDVVTVDEVDYEVRLTQPPSIDVYQKALATQVQRGG